MSSTTHVLRVELHDSPSRVHGARLQARLLVNGATLQTSRILTTSLWPKLLKDVEWYLEEFIYGDAFATARASTVERDFQNACRRAAVDLELERVLSSSPFAPLDHVELQIVNHCEDLYDLAFAFPWELLEHTELWSTLRKSVTISRLIPEGDVSGDGFADDVSGDRFADDVDNAPEWNDPVNGIPHAENPAINDDSESSINILLVLARAADTLDGRPRDIPPFVALEAITQLSNRLLGRRRLNVEVARPGTWNSVKQSLAKHPPGHYSVVHFDVHGGTRAKAPSLSFADPDGSGRLKKEFVATVARALKKAAVQNVVLNACGSASNAHGAHANPAHIFLQHGVTSVVGMSHRASAQAMSLFLKHFYEELIASASFSAATAIGRRVLSDNRSRRTNQQVDRDLSDYILPVFYSSDVLSASITSTGMLPEDPAEIVPITRSTYIEGRDFDILQLENALRDQPIVCIHGAAGVGKSTLLRRAGDIWDATGLFDAYTHVDMSHPSIKDLESFLDALKTSASSERPLVIIDNVQDALALTGAESSRHLSKLEWRRIQKYIETHSRAKYILASRTLALFTDSIIKGSKPFELRGFHPLDSRTLLRRELGSQSSQWSADDRQSTGLLLEMLQHNPVAIHLMIPWITSLNIGIHDFMEGLIDWRLDAEGSRYWQTLGREQFKIPALVDITRCFMRLDLCGQHTWLWIALFWDHGPQVSTMMKLIDRMTPEVENSIIRSTFAVKLGEEHGLYVIAGDFIRHVSPLFTIWMRYCLLHALRVLRDVEPDPQGNLHANFSIGQWRTIMSGNNPLKVTRGDHVSAMFEPAMLETYKEIHGTLKAFWAGVFSDILVDFKDSTDFKVKGERTREMRFNYLGCFNALMGSQYVLDQGNMQFFELRLFWMMIREHADDHETALHSRKILQLMEYMTSQVDISKLAPFRVESAIGLLLMPISKAMLTPAGIGPTQREMLKLAQSIWRSCEARYGSNIPAHIAAERPFLQMMSATIQGKSDFDIKDTKAMFAETFGNLAKAMPDDAARVRKGHERWVFYLDKVNAQIASGDLSFDKLRSSMEDMRQFHPVAFDNPFDSVVREHQDKDKSEWPDQLTEALQIENHKRACKFLKLMIRDAMSSYEWDKSRQLLDVFWELKPKYTSLPAEDLQEFVDLDSTTIVQHELEQCFLYDAPAEKLRAAFENFTHSHSFYNADVDKSGDSEDAKGRFMMDQMMPLLKKLLDTTDSNTTDTPKALKSFIDMAQEHPWLSEQVPSWKRAVPMLASATNYSTALKRSKELAAAADFPGARKELREATEALTILYEARKEMLPDFRRGGDVPEDLALRKNHFDVLSAYGASAACHAFLGNVPIQTAVETFEEAMQVARQMGGASLSELPLGYASSIRQTRSYMLEVDLVAKTSADDLAGAMRTCHELLGVLTAVATDLPPTLVKKLQWYRDLGARLGAFHHARQWRTLTDAFRPHLAQLHLKRIGVFHRDMDFDGPTNDMQRFWSFGMAMSACTGLQLNVLRALGPAVGNDFWRRCRAALPYDERSDFMSEKFQMGEVIYMQGFMELMAFDLD